MHRPNQNWKCSINWNDDWAKVLFSAESTKGCLCSASSTITLCLWAQHFAAIIFSLFSIGKRSTTTKNGETVVVSWRDGMGEWLCGHGAIVADQADVQKDSPNGKRSDGWFSHLLRWSLPPQVVKTLAEFWRKGTALMTSCISRANAHSIAEQLPLYLPWAKFYCLMENDWQLKSKLHTTSPSLSISNRNGTKQTHHCCQENKWEQIEFIHKWDQLK